MIAGVRNPDGLDEASKVEGVDYRGVDVEDWDSLDALLEGLQKEGANLSGVALCVGSILLKPAHLTRREEFESVLSKNLVSAFGVVRAAVRHVAAPGGSIVLVSSAAARHGLVNHEAIAAAKAGVEGLVRSAAATYAGRGIRINCVAPGLVDTPLAAKITGNEGSLNISRKLHPLGRIGTAEEVAGAITWLLQADQGWVTGQVIGVDGGLSTVRSQG